LYNKHPLCAAGTVAFLLTTLSAVDPADAQTISTPAGELQLGVTEGEVTRLLQSSVDEQKASDGTVVSRRVWGKIGQQTFGAGLTSRGIAYTISADQWYPNDSVGQQAAEQLFQHYLQIYSAPTFNPVIREGKAAWQDWTNSDGDRIKTAITDCSDFDLSVQVSDYQRELKDDGVSEDQRGRQSFDRGQISDCF
jgi:hypothetical protein